MVVLVIIGLMSGVVMMTLPDRTPPEEALGEALLMRLNAAAEDSLMTGQPKAFGVSSKSYGLYEYIDAKWEISGEAEWPETVTASLEKDGNRVELKSKLAPLVSFDPTGLSSVFDLTLNGDDMSLCLSSIGDGRVTLGYEPCGA